MPPVPECDGAGNGGGGASPSHEGRDNRRAAGRVAVSIYDDGGAVIERVVLCHEDGCFGMNIPKNVWHTVECLEPAVLFECKEGPFVPHEQEGFLEINSIHERKH